MRGAVLCLSGGVGARCRLGAAGAAPRRQPAAPAAQLPGRSSASSLTAGRSTVLTTDFDITRIAVTNPAVADAIVVQPREMLIDGKAPGTVSLIVWGDDATASSTTSSSSRRHDAPAAAAGAVSRRRHPRSASPRKRSSSRATSRATPSCCGPAEIAQATSSKIKVINMLQLPGGSESQQVMLQVRFAEVNRRALTELGVVCFTRPRLRTMSAARRRSSFAAPDFDDARTDGRPGLQRFPEPLLLQHASEASAPSSRRCSDGLLPEPGRAEPDRLQRSGSELPGRRRDSRFRSCRADAPAPSSVVYKEFGIRLKFTPTIAGDMIRLKVRPEVSTLDSPTASRSRASAFRRSRRGARETDVELRDGQSFAIAGLLDNLSQDDAAAIPFLSRLPIIGNLFKSKADRAERTELMVLITPRLVRPLDPDEVPPLPTLPRRFLPGTDRHRERRAGHRPEWIDSHVTESRIREPPAASIDTAAVNEGRRASEGRSPELRAVSVRVSTRLVVRNTVRSSSKSAWGSSR